VPALDTKIIAPHPRRPALRAILRLLLIGHYVWLSKKSKPHSEHLVSSGAGA